jgi:hypothetical protein
VSRTQCSASWRLHCRAGTHLTRDQRNRGTWEALRIELICQIAPFRIEFFDQFNFPSASPSLQRMLSRTCFENGFECLEMHQQIDAISLGEARNQLRFVLRHSSREIVVTPMYRSRFACQQGCRRKKKYPWVDSMRAGWDGKACRERSALPIAMGPGSASQHFAPCPGHAESILSVFLCTCTKRAKPPIWVDRFPGVAVL